MFNHSCLPNCLWYLIGDCLFIYVCSSNIRQGDELTISYCPLWISSLNERTYYLRQYGIHSCRCLLCSYDRSNMPQYEIELKKFINLRALSRQKNLSFDKRFEYIEKLKSIYEYLIKKFRQRPIGFINEFNDLEYIIKYFLNDNKQENSQEFLNERQTTFLQRLSRICRFTIKDLPKVGNPILLFGIHMQVRIKNNSLIDFIKKDRSILSDDEKSLNVEEVSNLDYRIYLNEFLTKILMKSKKTSTKSRRRVLILFLHLLHRHYLFLFIPTSSSVFLFPQSKTKNKN